MKRAIAYLLFLLAFHGLLLAAVLNQKLPDWLTSQRQIVLCGVVAGVAGALYCLRSVYITKCIRQVPWDDLWLPWYFIRPIVSPFCGVVAYFFLKAGLLILDASQTANHQFFGFYAIAFIAGYNVDKFLAKIEQLSEGAWGIEKSPSAVREGRPPATDRPANRPGA